MSIIQSRALVGDGRNGFQLTDTSIGTPGPNEVVVRIRASGICHTDYDSISVARSPYVLGHEGAGEIAQIGDSVDDLQIGQRVLLTWAIACGHCFQCARGHPVHCEVLGQEHGHAHTGSTQQGSSDIGRFFQLGTMSTHAIVRREAVVPLPDGIPFASAALLGCAVMTGFGSAVNSARISAGSSVVVIGCGGVGLSVIQGARISGASDIVAIDVDEKKFAMARRMGATSTVLAVSSDLGLAHVSEAIRGLFEGRGADFAFECTAVPSLALAPLAMVRDGGVAIQVSGVEEKISADMTLFEWDKTYLNPLYGGCNPSIDFPRLFRLYQSGDLLLDEMITRTYELADYATAFDDLRQGRNAKGVFVLDE